MTKALFEKYPLVLYDIDGSKNYISAINITARIAFREYVKNNTSIFYKYIIEEGYSPEVLAARYYKDPNYVWIILLANDIIDVYSQWPKSYKQLESYLIGKYGQDLTDIRKKTWTLSDLDPSLGGDPTLVHHYEDYAGREIDFYAYKDQMNNPPLGGSPEYVTYYDYEVDNNESLRNIILPKKEYKDILDEQLKSLLIDTVK